MRYRRTQRVDFWVQYCENPREQAMKILDYVFLERVRCQKQTILVITGDPGEAKSSIGQALTEKLLANGGISYAPYVNDVTVYVPTEFPEKEEALLYDPRLKEIPIMIIDEARLVVKAKNWHEFLNQAIADVVALQRRVKRIFLIIITQDLDDIDKDVRRLVTYWGEAYRPLHGPAELHISRFYKDTRRPAKIELEKRSLRGIIEFPDKRRKLDFPSRFVFSMPSTEVWNTYDRQNYLSKGAILKKRLLSLVERMKRDAGEGGKRLNSLLSYFLTKDHWKELMFHFKNTGRNRNWILRKESAELLGLNDREEIKEFSTRARQGIMKLSEPESKEVLIDGVQKETA